MRLQLFNRLLMPVLLVTGGVAFVVFGAKFHVAQVFEKKEVTETIKIPAPFSPSGGLSGTSPWGGGMSSGGTMPGNDADDEEPAFTTQKVTRTIYVPKNELEPMLIRQLTVGGVRLIRDSDAEDIALDSGKLLQTYSGDAPALCPT